MVKAIISLKCTTVICAIQVVCTLIVNPSSSKSWKMRFGFAKSVEKGRRRLSRKGKVDIIFSLSIKRNRKV